MTVTVEIPLVLVNPTNRREHWGTRAKRVKKQRGAVRLMLKAQRVGAIFSDFAPLAVTLTRVAPRAMDDDGAIAALKHVRDEVAAYFGMDDADPRITWAYAQERGPATVRIAFEVRSVGVVDVGPEQVAE